MHRAFVSTEAIVGRTITLTDPQVLHHLVTVVRARVGELITCVDETRATHHGSITRCDRHAMVIDVDRVDPPPATSRLLWLAPSLLPADRFSWLIQKATELGVDRVTPMITQRTIVKISATEQRQKLKRWQRIVQETSLQCARTTPPVIEAPQSFSQWLRALSPKIACVLPTLAWPTRMPLLPVLKRLSPTIPLVMCIGPEGDFSPEEITLAITVGAIPVTLGRFTLRAETAALAVLAIAQSLNEESCDAPT